MSSSSTWERHLHKTEMLALVGNFSSESPLLLGSGASKLQAKALKCHRKLAKLGHTTGNITEHRLLSILFNFIISSLKLDPFQLVWLRKWACATSSTQTSPPRHPEWYAAAPTCWQLLYVFECYSQWSPPGCFPLLPETPWSSLKSKAASFHAGHAVTHTPHKI